MSKVSDEALAAFRAAIAVQRTPLPRPPADTEPVIHGSDLPWYTPADNSARLAPVLGTPIKTFELFLQEFPPGATSDMQRHHHEAVHYIIAGQGSSQIGDQRYPWSQGDFVCIPPLMWHRHYNGSPTESVRMLLIENTKLLEALGMNYRESVGLLDWEELPENLRGGGPA
jgi:quercetin dioxygenase-like cupin family protein